MNKLIQNKISDFDELFSQVNKDFKWELKISKIFISLMYTIKGKKYVKENVDNLIKLIKDNTGLFSHYRGHNLFILSTLLCSEYDNPESKFIELLEYKNIFKDAGLKASLNLPISSYTLLLASKYDQPLNIAKKASEVYKEMKKNHPWLTDSNDIPLAILIAALNADTNIIEDYYKKLNENGFSKSNGLQLLSQILSFSDASVNETSENCIKLYKNLKENKLNVSTQYYSALGTLSMIYENDSFIDEIIEITKYISSMKNYKWIGKGSQLLLASSFVSSAYLENIQGKSDISKTALGVSINSIIAAQNLANMSTMYIAATTASASASGG